MMNKKSLQEQYNKIKDGKGNKNIFLKEAKAQFPNLIRKSATYSEAVRKLDSRNIIKENFIGYPQMIGGLGTSATPKEGWEESFQNYLNEEAEVKAEVKKTSKEVEDSEENAFDNTDTKNLDNLISQQVYNGIYFEAFQNPDKTIDEIKKIVGKNLNKEPLYYMKNAMFSVEGVEVEQQVQQEATGKYADIGSGYGEKLKDLVQEALKKPYKKPLKENLMWMGEYSLIGAMNDGLEDPDLFDPDEEREGRRMADPEVGPTSNDIPDNQRGDFVDDPRGGPDDGPYDFVDEEGNLKSKYMHSILSSYTDASNEEIQSYINDTEAYLEPEAYTGLSLEDLLDDFLVNYNDNIDEKFGGNADNEDDDWEDDMDPDVRAYFEKEDEDWKERMADRRMEESYDDEDDYDEDDYNEEEDDEQRQARWDLEQDDLDWKERMADRMMNEEVDGEETDVDEIVDETETEEDIKPEKMDRKKRVKKETLDTRLAEIERLGGITTLEAKIETVDEEIASRSERMAMIGENQDLADLIDAKKLKSMQKDIKDLQKRSDNLKKLYEKTTKTRYQKPEEMVDEGSEEQEQFEEGSEEQEQF